MPLALMNKAEEMKMKQSLQKMNALMEAARREKDVGPKAAEDVLKILDNAINEIYMHNATSLGFEELYSKAFFMVWHNFGEVLYIKIASTITFYIKEMAASIEASQGPLFLQELNKKWMEHSKAFDILRCIFMCMDRRCTPNTHKAHVLELGVQLWVDNVIHCTNIQMRMKDALLEIVQRERDGEVVSRDLMKTTLRMLMDLGPSVYQEMFEKPLLDLSTNLYRGKSQQLIECCECGDYLKKAEKCLNEEMERLSDYLGAKRVTKTTPLVEKGMVENHKPRVYHPVLVAKSIAKITNVVEKEMIESFMARLINSGLVNMIVNKKYDDLAIMYNLFQRVPNGLKLMRGAMTCHIEETGKQLVTNPESLQDPIDFVQRVLEEKDKHDKIINLAFNNDITFQNALNSSFEYFINLNPRFLEFISLFVNDKLGKGVNEDDMEIVLDKVMMLTGYLQEKDILEKLGKLTWQTNLGSAAIIATVGTNKKDQLNISTNQMCVLMLFNNADRLSYKEIEEAVKIPTMELKTCLQSLACAEEKNILRKELKGKDICEEDVFFVNECYKVKVSSGILVAHNALEPEMQDTMQSVDNGKKGNLQSKLLTPMCVLVTSGFLLLQILGKKKRSCSN